LTSSSAATERRFGRLSPLNAHTGFGHVHLKTAETDLVQLEALVKQTTVTGRNPAL